MKEYDVELWSYDIEHHVLGGILKHQHYFADVDVLISDKDFHSKLNATIYCVIKAFLSKNKSIDAVLIAQRINELGIAFDDNISVVDYITNITFAAPNPQGLLQACNELVKLRVRRELLESTNRLANYIKTTSAESVEAIISDTDKIYGDSVAHYVKSADFKDIFGDIHTVIRDRGKNPMGELGLATPFPAFNEMYGGLRDGNVYAWVSRPGHGKTTMLNYLALHTCVSNKCKALILDTEMDTTEIAFRNAAAITNIPAWFLETGNWSRNEDYRRRYEDKEQQLLANKGYVAHVNVAGKPIDTIVAMIRRWFFKYVGKGNKGIVIYDYIKLTGENTKNTSEWALIGEKVNKLKELSIELQVPVLTACQMNRSAEDGVEHSGAIALSDRLLWFATFVGIFRRKTVEEIANHGEQFGTHICVPLKARFQGRSAGGHHDWVRIQQEDGRVVYRTNFINYNVDNFEVQERGTLRHIIDAQELRPNYPNASTDVDNTINTIQSGT